MREGSPHEAETLADALAQYDRGDHDLRAELARVDVVQQLRAARSTIDLVALALQLDPKSDG